MTMRFPPGAIRLVEPGEPVSEGKLLAVVLNTDASGSGDTDPSNASGQHQCRA